MPSSELSTECFLCYVLLLQYNQQNQIITARLREQVKQQENVSSDIIVICSTYVCIYGKWQVIRIKHMDNSKHTSIVMTKSTKSDAAVI